MFNIVTLESCSTVLFHIVDNYEQYGQQNIVQSCYATASEYLAVCSDSKRPRSLFMTGGGGGGGEGGYRLEKVGGSTKF